MEDIIAVVYQTAPPAELGSIAVWIIGTLLAVVITLGGAVTYVARQYYNDLLKANIRLQGEISDLRKELSSMQERFTDILMGKLQENNEVLQDVKELLGK